MRGLCDFSHGNDGRFNSVPARKNEVKCMFGITNFLDAHKSFWKLVKAGILLAGSYLIGGFLGSPEAGITIGAIATGLFNYVKHNYLK